MRKLLFAIMAILLICGTAMAESYIADQKTVAWNPVTTNADGVALPEGSDVRYRVYIMNSATSETAEVTIEPITETQHTITYPAEVKFYFGVQAVRYIEGADPIETEIVWSSVGSNCQNGEPIDISHFRPPANVTGLSIP